MKEKKNKKEEEQLEEECALSPLEAEVVSFLEEFKDEKPKEVRVHVNKRAGKLKLPIVKIDKTYQNVLKTYYTYEDIKMDGYEPLTIMRVAGASDETGEHAGHHFSLKVDYEHYLRNLAKRNQKKPSS